MGKREAGAPEGVVTLLFTDIEGSTKILQRTGDEYSAILSAHHAVLRDAIARHDGHEVDTAGDGFFVTFASAEAGVRCALDMQIRLAEHPLLAPEQVRVRMGLHTGDVQLVDGDYLGLAVHHAARVAGAGHGGQVLVSESTRALAGTGEEWSYIPLGAHELKDLARPIELFQLAHPQLCRDFAPIRSLSRGASNLPRPRTSLVGRDEDVAVLAELAARPGLITLTGPGGCGKTRLALATAQTVIDTAPGGVFFVDLRPAQNDAHVAEAVAGAVGVDDPSGSGDPAVATARAATRLGHQRAVVVLDNCEHVVAAAADIVDELLSSCPDLTVIATSRDLLGLDDEIARRVSSLGFPDGRESLDDWRAFSALVLFDERARRANPQFDMTADSETVARICRRLDGMPLAIELAAARLRHMGVAALEQQLSDMFRVLVGSDRRAVQRHQTLEAVVAWSFDLLEPAERDVLVQLSVFLGAFTLADAEAMCESDRDIGVLVFALVDRSLVDAVGGERYRLLETIRAYGQRELQQTGVAAAVRARHLDHVVAAVERMGEATRSDRFFEGIDELEPLADDIRAALDWALESGDLDRASRLVADAPIFWHITGRWSDAERAEQHLADGGGDPLLLARASAGYAWARTLGPTSDTPGHIARAHERYAGVGPGRVETWFGWLLVADVLQVGLTGDAAEVKGKAEAATAWWGDAVLPRAYVDAAQGWAMLRSADDLAGARVLLAKALESARASGNGLALGACLFWCGLASMHAFDYAAARSFYEEGLLYYRRARHKLWLQWELDHLSGACTALDDIDAARAYAEEGLAVSRESGLVGRGNYYSLLSTVGSAELFRGDLDQAAMYHREALAVQPDAERGHFRVPLLCALAAIEVERGETAAACQLAQDALDVVRTLKPERFETGALVQPPVAQVLNVIGSIVGLNGQAERGLMLRGAAHAARDENEPEPTGRRAELMERRHRALRDQLPEETADAAWAKGLDLEDPFTEAEAALKSVR